VLLHLANLYLADVAPHGAWAYIKAILPGLRYHERKRFTFVVIEVGVSQDSIVGAND
jgi:hypothetical protein